MVADTGGHRIRFRVTNHLHLPPDKLPWLAVAERVIAGEFTNADSSMRKSLLIGLRSLGHPIALRAYAIISTASAPKELRQLGNHAHACSETFRSFSSSGLT